LLLDAIRRELQIEGLTKLADGNPEDVPSAFSTRVDNASQLKLNADCHRFYAKNTLGDAPGPDGPVIFSEQRLAAAKAHFREYLSQKRKELGAVFKDWLVELRRKVTLQLKLVVYVVGDESEVGVVFETMNNRGKVLTELEKVKNYLLYLTTKMSGAGALSASVNEAWATIFKTLMLPDSPTRKIDCFARTGSWRTASDEGLEREQVDQGKVQPEDARREA